MSFIRLIYRNFLKYIYNLKMIIYNNERKFNYIFKKNIWGSTESISGPGSEIKNTILIRKQIPNLLAEFNIKSLLDIPCGDFNWLKEVDLNINYLGADIVESIINKNILKYTTNSVTFTKLDITSDDIIEQFDLILVRDLFIHFSNKDIYKSLQNIKKSKSKYILTTNYNDTKINKDIISGSFREINFMIEPFNFPTPIQEINDSGNIMRPNTDIPYQNKYLSLWDLRDLKI